MYGEFQCIMGNGHMGPPLNKMTHTIENITFPQLRWRAVKMLCYDGTLGSACNASCGNNYHQC